MDNWLPARVPTGHSPYLVYRGQKKRSMTLMLLGYALFVVTALAIALV